MVIMMAMVSSGLVKPARALKESKDGTQWVGEASEGVKRKQKWERTPGKARNGSQGKKTRDGLEARRYPQKLGTECDHDLEKIPTFHPKVREIYKRYQVPLLLP